MKIMIVEDNHKVRELIKKIVKMGVKEVDAVYQCRDGQEAVKRYPQFKPDWVLMDIRMDPVNGLTASRKIKEEHPEANIIVVTHYADPSYRETARKLGVRAYVLKENLADLPVLIRNML